MARAFPSLSALVGDAVRLARSRLLTLCALALLPLLPLGLLGPFAVEVLVALDAGITSGFASFVSPLAIFAALVGLLLSVAVGQAATVGTFVVLGSPSDLGPRAAFRVGARRWLTLLWTEALVVLAILLAAAPSVVFSWWAKFTVGPFLRGEPFVAALVLVVSVLLLLPSLVVATWYAFAPIPAARGEAWGSGALTVSRRLVEGATGRAFGLLLAWFLFEMLFSLILAALFPGLVLFQRLVFYFTTTILSAAYLFTVYQALRRA